MSQSDFSWEILEKIQVVEMNGAKSVLVEGKTYMNWASGDETAERMAIAQLYKLKLGTQEEMAKVFNVHINSVAKYIKSESEVDCFVQTIFNPEKGVR